MRNIIKQTLLMIIIFLGSQCLVFAQQNGGEQATYLATCDEYYQADDYLNALQCYDIVYEQDSTIPMVNYRLGNCYFKIFRFDLAFKHFKAAIKMEYRVGDALYNIGLMYAIQDKNELALQFFELSLEWLPNDDEVKSKIKQYKKVVDKKE